MEIVYLDAQTGEEKLETVYGEKAVEWLYSSKWGRKLNPIITSKLISQVYGLYQDCRLSQSKILPFIKKFNIDIDEFEPKLEGEVPYESFNQFFIRRFKPGKRSFPVQQDCMGAPCEARYYGWNKITEEVNLPVKGKFLKASKLVGKSEWAKDFTNGPGYIARLCPVDYHRFHHFDDAKVLDHYSIQGKLDSVNPLALQKKPQIFLENERAVTILETQNFGKIAYIEVGATCVGKIVQTHNLERVRAYQRGQEKGYFLFGGSTVIVLGEPGAWELSSLLIDNTCRGREVYYQLGRELARSV